MRPKQVFAAIGACAVVGCLATLPTRAADLPLRDEHTLLIAGHAEVLEGIALNYQKRGQTEAARRVQAYLPRRDPMKLYLFIPSSTNEDAAVWKKYFAAAFRQQADDLFALAERAAKEHEPGLCCELLFEVLHENPDHADARKLLGYVPARDGWQRPFEQRQRESGKAWHDRFGWLKEDQLARYERGERFYRNRWMSADEESRLRTAIERAWRIETEHFAVATNHSLEEGAALAQRLEKLHAVWKNIFPGYLSRPAEFARRFEKRTPRFDAVRRHDVVYYRTRAEYDAALRPSQPRIEMTLGIYFDTARTAYFFAGENQNAATLDHEATHQLFQESRATKADFARRGNFWVVEAVACYMESLATHEGYVTLGGLDAGRVPAARQRLEEGFYLPLEELVSLGVDDFQGRADIAKLYSQSAGLATFFMHAEAGRFRESFTAYLDAVYAGRANEGTLEKLCGVDYGELDRRYREFLAPKLPATGNAE